MSAKKIIRLKTPSKPTLSYPHNHNDLLGSQDEETIMKGLSKDDQNIYHSLIEQLNKTYHKTCNIIHIATLYITNYIPIQQIYIINMYETHDKKYLSKM